MKNLRQISSSLFLSLLFLLLFMVKSEAATSYTVANVATHNTASDCWVIYDQGVYDITSYLATHDQRYMNIDSWCGTDITTAFQTKDGQGQDHRSSSYTLLESFRIGDLTAVATTSPVPTVTVTPRITSISTTIPTITATPTITITKTTTTSVSNRYNFVLPFVLSLSLYLVLYFTTTRGWFNKILILPKLNVIMNTLLVISLIPSVCFGFFMIFQYSIPALANINFDFLYWHVEGSVVFGTLVLCHYLQRFKQYLIPFRLFKRKPSVVSVGL